MQEYTGRKYEENANRQSLIIRKYKDSQRQSKFCLTFAQKTEEKSATKPQLKAYIFKNEFCLTFAQKKKEKEGRKEEEKKRTKRKV